ncbi:MAG: thioredoxin family protein [Alphaproteobacteria bacterium]|nr:thioredoxin family protein [Alphaproteobacteria bacterium]
MQRRTLLAASLLAAVPLAIARAGTQAPFDAGAFAAAQAAGKPILVFVHASWCPTCAKQQPIIADLAKTADNRDLMIFIVDFDSQKDVVKTFGVRSQSTLIAFHGKTERDRSTGATEAAIIAALVAKTRA